MDLSALQGSIKGVDIYLLDQILKNRYQPKARILDAGCGKGRNLLWFYNNGYEIHGTDLLSDRIEHCRQVFSNQADHFLVSTVETMPYVSNDFDHIICNAVLHFAKNSGHFLELFGSLVEILKPQGSIFIRMASEFGLESRIELLSEGVYKLPDGSTRFLLNEKLLKQIQVDFGMKLVETVKTTLVYDMRSMTTLVFEKEG